MTTLINKVLNIVINTQNDIRTLTKVINNDQTNINEGTKNNFYTSYTQK